MLLLVWPRKQCLKQFTAFLTQSSNSPNKHTGLSHRVFIPVKRHHDHGNSYEENNSLRRLTYSLKGSIYYHYDREHGSVQADVVLELRVLHLTGNRKLTDSHSEGN